MSIQCGEDRTCLQGLEFHILETATLVPSAAGQPSELVVAASVALLLPVATAAVAVGLEHTYS